MFGTLAYEAVNDRSKLLPDATEMGLGMLPVASEILDFKAAITGHDLAHRDLSLSDRWIRAGF